METSVKKNIEQLRTVMSGVQMGETINCNMKINQKEINELGAAIMSVAAMDSLYISCSVEFNHVKLTRIDKPKQFNFDCITYENVVSISISLHSNNCITSSGLLDATALSKLEVANPFFPKTKAYKKTLNNLGYKMIKKAPTEFSRKANKHSLYVK